MILRLFTNELRKLLNMRICVAIVLLLAVDLISLHISVAESAKKYERLEPYRDDFAELERVCAQDPDYYIAYHDELVSEYDRQYREWMDSDEVLFPPIGEDGEPIQQEFDFTSPSTLVEGYEDHEIFNLYDEYSSGFAEKLRNSVDTAYENLKLLDRFGIAEDTPTSDYQRKMIDLYGGILEETDASSTVVVSWSELLGYENRIIFLFLGAMLLAVQIGFVDRESGVEPLLRTCRRGRKQPALAKCGTIVVASAGMAILLNLSEILYMGLRFGLSSPLRALQNIENYIYSPYAISILEALLLNLIGMVLSASLLGMLVILLTALTRQVVLPLIISGLFMVANLLLHWILLFGDWRVFNLIEPASGSLLMRPPVIALQGLGDCLYPLMIELIALFIAVFVVLTVVVYSYRRPTTKTRRISGLAAFLESNLRSRKRTRRLLRVRRPSLMRGELRKCLSPLLLAAILLLVGIRVQQATERFEPSTNSIEVRKRNYASEYGGVLTAEKANALHARYDSAVAIIDEDLREQQDMAYALGELSVDDYFDYLEEVSNANAELPVLSEVNAHITYLEHKAEKLGKQTVYFYDGGYEDFFGLEFDLPLYLLVLLGLSAIFAKEYAGDSSKGGFIQILRTTKNGRTPVFLRKLAWAAIYSGGLTLAFALLDLFLLWKGEGLPALSAPLVSMERYADVASGITVGGYLVLCIALRLLGALVLALLTTTLSCLLKNTKLVLALTAAITLLPYALYYFGIKLARYFDFTTLLSGDRLWLNSWEAGSAALLVGFVAATVVLTGALTAHSYNKFCK